MYFSFPYCSYYIRPNQHRLFFMIFLLHSLLSVFSFFTCFLSFFLNYYDLTIAICFSLTRIIYFILLYFVFIYFLLNFADKWIYLKLLTTNISCVINTVRAVATVRSPLSLPSNLPPQSQFRTTKKYKNVFPSVPLFLFLLFSFFFSGVGGRHVCFLCVYLCIVYSFCSWKCVLCNGYEHRKWNRRIKIDTSEKYEFTFPYRYKLKLLALYKAIHIESSIKRKSTSDIVPGYEYYTTL